MVVARQSLFRGEAVVPQRCHLLRSHKGVKHQNNSFHGTLWFLCVKVTWKEPISFPGRNLRSLLESNSFELVWVFFFRRRFKILRYFHLVWFKMTGSGGYHLAGEDFSPFSCSVCCFLDINCSGFCSFKCFLPLLSGWDRPAVRSAMQHCP